MVATTPLAAPSSDFIGSCHDRFVANHAAPASHLEPHPPPSDRRLRLRDAVGSLEEEAVLDPDGRCLYAEGRARSRTARERLRDAARAVLRARGGLRRTAPRRRPRALEGLRRRPMEPRRPLRERRPIAVERDTSERTIANQLRAVFRKLGVATRAELVARAARPRRSPFVPRRPSGPCRAAGRGAGS